MYFSSDEPTKTLSEKRITDGSHGAFGGTRAKERKRERENRTAYMQESHTRRMKELRKKVDRKRV